MMLRQHSTLPSIMIPSVALTLLHQDGGSYRTVVTSLPPNPLHVRDIIMQGWTALMHAASRGDLAVARVLVVRNVDVDARCKESVSPAPLTLIQTPHMKHSQHRLSGEA